VNFGSIWTACRTFFLSFDSGLRMASLSLHRPLPWVCFWDLWQTQLLIGPWSVLPQKLPYTYRPRRSGMVRSRLSTLPRPCRGSWLSSTSSHNFHFAYPERYASCFIGVSRVSHELLRMSYWKNHGRVTKNGIRNKWLEFGCIFVPRSKSIHVSDFIKTVQKQILCLTCWIQMCFEKFFRFLSIIYWANQGCIWVYFVGDHIFAEK